MTDNELLEQLFRPAKEIKLQDDGFTNRVMHQVAILNAQHSTVRVRRLSRLWTAFCILIAVVSFIIMRGWEPILYGLLMLFNSPPTQHQILLMITSAGLVGLVLAIEVFHRERYSVI